MCERSHGDGTDRPLALLCLPLAAPRCPAQSLDLPPRMLPSCLLPEGLQSSMDRFPGGAGHSSLSDSERACRYRPGGSSHRSFLEFTLSHSVPI